MNSFKSFCIWGSVALLTAVCIFLLVSGLAAPNALGLIPFAFNSVALCYSILDRHNKNIIPLCILSSFLTCFGGGLLRDLILSRLPSVFSNVTGLSITFFATLIAIAYFHSKAIKIPVLERIMYESEYYVLITFILDGALITIEHGYRYITTLIVCSLLTGCGGGILSTILVYKCHPKKVCGTVIYIVKTITCGILLVIFKEFPYHIRCFITYIVYLNCMTHSDRMLLLMKSMRCAEYLGFPCSDITNVALKKSLIVHRYYIFINYYSRLENSIKQCLSNLKAKRKVYFYYRNAIRDF